MADAPEPTTAVAPIRVGLVGAGPWAAQFHAPMLATGPETSLAGVWARRPGAASALAAAHEVPAMGTIDELLACCEAVAFAVPPDVQAEHALRAAEAGKHLLLDKPLALTLPAARRLADHVTRAGVVSHLVLPYRYLPRVRAFARSAASFPTLGLRASMLSGVLASASPFATPWRRREGALADLGPHMFDLLELVAGPIVDMRASGDPLRWITLSTSHVTGIVGTAALSLVLPREDGLIRCRLYGPSGRLDLLQPTSHAEAEVQFAEATAALRADFAARVRTGRAGTIDAAHGLHLQTLLHQANRTLTT